MIVIRMKIWNWMRTVTWWFIWTLSLGEMMLKVPLVTLAFYVNVNGAGYDNFRIYDQQLILTKEVKRICPKI
jgi:hypothetical protein